jgi:hypothetical protein
VADDVAGIICQTVLYGHLELLMWLQERGCPAVLGRCIDGAARGGFDEVVEWLGQFTARTW